MQDSLEVPRHASEAAGGGRRTRVTFGAARLEPMVAFAVGGMTLWATVFLNPPGELPWLLAAYAAAIGAWARSYQAQHEGMLLLRAAMLQAGGALLLFSPDFGGPLDMALYWPLTTTIGYALLLGPRSAALVGLGGIALFIAACVDASSPLKPALASLGALGILPLLAARMGLTLRASDQQVEHTRRDPASLLYNGQGFFTHGAVLFDDCRRDGRPFTLVLLSAADLRDVGDLLGRRAANELFTQTVRAIAAATSASGIAARTDGVEFALAMPGVTVERAEALLHQHLGRPPQVKLILAGAEAAIMLDAVSAQAPAELHTLEELYDRLHQELRKRTGFEDTKASGFNRGGSTFHGLLLQEPPMPASQRPTLPMPLSQPREAGAKRSARRSRPDALRPR